MKLKLIATAAGTSTAVLAIVCAKAWLALRVFAVVAM